MGGGVVSTCILFPHFSIMKFHYKIAVAGICCFTVAASVFAVTYKFSDVPVGSYYEQATSNMSMKGIMKGSNGLFSPGENVNRAQLVTVLNRYDMNIVQPLIEQIQNFRDRDITALKGSSWAKYMQVASTYPIQLAHGEEGFGFDPTLDYTSLKLPSGWTIAYDGVKYNSDGMDGFQIVTSDNAFFIRQYVGGLGLVKEANGVLHGSGAFGLFRDDVARLVKEAKGS